MRSDMFPASSYGKWETVMIVEEMEGEGVPGGGGGSSGGGGVSSDQAKGSEAPAEPLEKKGKYEVSRRPTGPHQQLFLLNEHAHLPSVPYSWGGGKCVCV